MNEPKGSSQKVGGTIAVVLNYRTPREAVAAVRSLLASQAPASAIIIVDNASGDDSKTVLEQGIPEARLIVADANGGFSAGCNLGIREALRLGADRVLLLNSDVVVLPDALGKLERAMDADSHIGIVGPVLVSRADPDVVQSMGMVYSETTGRMRHLGFRMARRAVVPFDRRDVDGVSGCAMLIKREVFERVGLLAEEYFFGFEDLDLCLRARRGGLRCALAGGATVLHEGSVSIGRESARRIYFATRNHLLLASRASPAGPLGRRYLRTALILGLNLAHLLVTSDVPRGRGLLGFIRGVRDHVARRYGPGAQDNIDASHAPPSGKSRA